MSEQNRPAGVYEAQIVWEWLRGATTREHWMLRDLLMRLWEWSNWPEVQGVFALASVHGWYYTPEKLATFTELWQEVKAIVEKGAHEHDEDRLV